MRAFTVSTIAMALFVTLGAGDARGDTVVQVPLPGLLDGRAVTTLTGGQIVVWTLTTDGNADAPSQNAYATAAVAALKGKPVANALPDDGRFPADARHPEVVLNFSNDADATAPQAHFVKPNTTFSFAMPAATYSKVFLFFSGAAGGTTPKITMTFSDATTQVQDVKIPDYYADITPDAVIFNLATNLAKWTKNTTIAEANHHNITGAELHPMPTKTLTKIQVDRGASGYLVFWGATGVATSAVAGLPDGGTDASAPTGTDARADAVGGDTSVAGASGSDANPTGAGGGGGASATGGTSGSSGAGGQSTGAAGTGAAGVSGGASGATGNAGTGSGDGGACGCRLSSRDGAATRGTVAWLLLAAATVWSRRQRRRGR